MGNASGSFKKLQRDSEKLFRTILGKLHEEERSVFLLLTYLLAEVGEVADKVRALEGDRINSEDITEEDLAKEIVDSIYNLMLIANYYEINLDKHWLKRLKGIEGKFK